MSRPRVLIVTYGFPYPPHSGGRLRYFNLLRALAPAAEIDLLSLLEFPEEAAHVAALRPYCRRIETVTSPAPQSWPGRLSAMLRGWPLPLQRYRAPALADRMRAMLREAAVDLVQIENLEMAPYVAALPPRLAAKKVLVLHNVSARQYRLPGQWSVARAARVRAWLKWRLLQGLDARLARRFDAVVTVSALDAQRLREQLPPGRGSALAVIPNGVDVETFQPLPPAPEPVILFMGTLGYEPNIDAVQFFATEVLPRVRQAVPAARFVIAGQHPAPGVLALAQLPGVTVTGAVPDVQPVYAQAQVVVVPLRAGGGTRLKILEALALGRPVVTTTIGNEGLDLLDAEHLRVADGAAALAQAVIELLRDPAQRAALAVRGRARVVERYGWPQLAAQQLALYEQLVTAA